MSRKTILTAWLVAGIVLALGPVLGTLPTMLGMVTAFRDLDQGGPQAADLEGSVRLGMWLTIAGLLVCPVGIMIVVVSAMKLQRNKNE
ncbi:MAG TPA: MotA/TolQ/ExbB proton channel family protein [Pirellulales bacterium]|nr:MotA/TolQ/ExbB proton channel family protein [Pirellulales bacterium]